ncbi:MAG: ATP-binding protein [Gammaproteobacteria bacterium]|nr:ATP-binding protein [Gammaproteobacteria bacterium]MBU1443263.1 ATP-binding protein [Gammaproteobacteria bacterium]MBU2286424.1 ATP-binding protein [Gammaproteobacteria bacterium]MBU2407691.1 ATP-binding protein [Gammaproteobacteria bacterium]
MRLQNFRITNFRSINDSGWVDVAQITAILGRNESGKSNLLRALHSLNPAEGFRALTPIKDFPRHRPLKECKDETSVVESVWALEPDELKQLAGILPRAQNVTEVTVSRHYEGKSRFISFKGIGALVFDEGDTKAKLKKVVAAVQAAADKLEDPAKTALNKVADAFELAIADTRERDDWAAKATEAFKSLRKGLAAAEADLTEKQESLVSELDELATTITGDETAKAKARSWVMETLPKFVYIDEYPDLKGHQNIAGYLSRKASNTPIDADGNFEKLCKVAGLSPQQLQDLLAANDQETRNQLVNRAGSVVTSEIRRLWKDRALKIRFNLDAHHLDTLVSDPNATYEVEVNLNERSRGFQWFFSFYITLVADTQGGKAESAILLFDEPGLYLHARSQSDLLRHFEDDFKNQILYSTHSPFMVPTHRLEAVRTVSIGEEAGTTVTNDPTGDARTLFPLQAALGYNIAQSLFIGSTNLIVEGVTDFWFLSTMSEHLADKGLKGLNPELTITPVGGAQKVSYMVALLTAEEQSVLVLLDQEKESVATKKSLVNNKLIAEQNVLFVSEAFSTAPAEADIEDLLDSQIYEALARESYASELKGLQLTLNSKIPRIVKQFEEAFKALGLTFHKTRPAALFLKKMAVNSEKITTPESIERFETLFKIVNERLSKNLARAAKPFR